MEGSHSNISIIKGILLPCLYQICTPMEARKGTMVSALQMPRVQQQRLAVCLFFSPLFPKSTKWDETKCERQGLLLHCSSPLDLDSLPLHPHLFTCEKLKTLEKINSLCLCLSFHEPHEGTAQVEPTAD